MLAPLTKADPSAIGPFRLSHRLGAGGMGVVYLGFGQDDQAVAVKVPAPELAGDPRFRARFRREVSAAQLIHSSSVASVVAADTEAESPWMATEYIQGSSLLDAVAGRGPLAPRLVVGFAAGLADGLVAMHAVGVVHRDLKPANVVLAWDGPKIIDFGVALTAGPSLGTDALGENSDPDMTQVKTQVGQRLGTFAWMAPEQLLGGQVGPPADVFAWGACLTYAITGHSPFRAGSAAESIARIQRDEPDLTGVPPELVDLVASTLAKDPAARPPATALVSRLVHQRVSTPLESDRAVETALMPWVAQPPTPPPPRVDGPREVAPPAPAGPGTPPGGTRRAGTGPLRTGPLGTGPLGTGPLGTGPLGTGPLRTGPLPTGTPGSRPRHTGPLATPPGGIRPGGAGPGGGVPVGPGIEATELLGWSGPPGARRAASGPDGATGPDDRPAQRRTALVGPDGPSLAVRVGLIVLVLLVVGGAAVLAAVLAQGSGNGSPGSGPRSSAGPVTLAPGPDAAPATPSATASAATTTAGHTTHPTHRTSTGSTSATATETTATTTATVTSTATATTSVSATATSTQTDGSAPPPDTPPVTPGGTGASAVPAA